MKFEKTKSQKHKFTKMQKIENFTPRRRLNMSGSSTDSMDVEFAAGKFFEKIRKSKLLFSSKNQFLVENQNSIVFCHTFFSVKNWKITLSVQKSLKWDFASFVYEYAIFDRYILNSGILVFFKDYETALFISGLDY